MVGIVYGHGNIMFFSDDVFCDLIDHALDHIEEYKIPFESDQLDLFTLIRDTLKQEPKKD